MYYGVNVFCPVLTINIYFGGTATSRDDLYILCVPELIDNDVAT